MFTKLPQERLFLGKSKKQEWEKIKERRDLNEIFPLWMRLGTSYPESAFSSSSLLLLEQCQEAIEKKAHDKLFEAFFSIFLAYFEKMLVPRLTDTEYQGIVTEKGPVTGTPLGLLKKSASLIRSLFISSNKKQLSFLPHLPRECYAGKMTGVVEELGSLDFEWTKKNMRRLHFSSKHTGEVLFSFPSHIKSFRLRRSYKEKGRTCMADIPLSLQSGTPYLFDRFQD